MGSEQGKEEYNANAYKINAYKQLDASYVQPYIVYNRLIKIDDYISKAEKPFGDPNIPYEDHEIIFDKPKVLIANRSNLIYTY